MNGVEHPRIVSVGSAAPNFTAPSTGIDGDIESFTLSENLNGAPIVLAFFPAAFTGTCTTKIYTFRDRVMDFEDVGAVVYGISINMPFVLTEFAEQSDLNFGLISDVNRELVDAYDVAMDFMDLGVSHVAKRAVFVVDGDGEVTYVWVSDDPDVEPDYKVVEAVARKLEAPNKVMQSRSTT